MTFLRRRLNDRVFFTGMATMFVLIDAGGLGSEFLRMHVLQDQWRSDWVKAHATAFTLWVVLFFAQAALVSAGRIDLHKRLGLGGIALYFVMLGLTLGAAISEAQNSPTHTALDFFMLHVVVHVDAIDFFALAGMALLLRRTDSDAHKRLMYLGTVALAIRFPLLGRITHLHQLPHYVDQDLFVLAAFAYDAITRGRVHRALLLGALVILIVPPLADYSFRTLVPQFMVHPAG
ncbi:MAG TPA: hypothetical protein VII56_21480 [Rhizomicrobium sp.]